MGSVIEIAGHVNDLRKGKERAVNFPSYRAMCLEPGCLWHWQSKDEPENPNHARTRAQAHAEVERHRVETVFDVYAQHDETFYPRGVRS